MTEGAIVTGGTKGLGRALSLELALAGFEVVAVYSVDDEAAHALAEDANARGLRVCCLRHDLSSGAPRIVEAERWSAIAIVNNAWPAFEPRPLHLVPWGDVERAIQVGVAGAYALVQSQLQRMVRARRGTVANILTAAIHDPVPKGFGGYVVAKHALRGLTLALAAEYADRGIRSFSVSPPYMETPLTARWNPELRAAMASQRAEVGEVAKAVVDLIRDPATGKRGEDYRVPR